MPTFTTNTVPQQPPATIDFGKSLGEVDIIISLSTQLADSTQFAAYCIKNAIKSDMSCKQILVTVKDMIKDNPVAMGAMLGDKLTDKILAS